VAEVVGKLGFALELMCSVIARIGQERWHEVGNQRKDGVVYFFEQ
jgi:hypothetical protein